MRNQRAKGAVISLRDALDLYLLDIKSRGLSSATLQSNRNHTTTFVKWCEEQGLVNLQDLTSVHIRKYLVSLQERKEPISNRYQVTLAKATKTFLNYCVRDELIEQSPFDKVKMIKQQKKILPAFSTEQVKAILNACENPRDLAICLMLLDSGLRASELLALNVGDVNIKTGVVSVENGKGQKDRIAYIGAKTQKALLEYLLSRRKPAGDQPLFLSLTSGDRLRLFGLAQLMERIRERTNIKICTAHTFRRTFAITCLRNGMNIYVLARIMGHVDITVLKQYLDLADEDTQTSHKKHGPADNWKI